MQIGNIDLLDLIITKPKMKYYIIFAVFAVLSCSDVDSRNVDEEERYLKEFFLSDNIDSLFLSADVVISINMDSLSEDKIVRKKSVRRIYIDSLDNSPNQLFAYPIRGMDFISENIVVASSASDEVRVIDLGSNYTIKRFTGGKGPGEFIAPAEVVANGTYVVISEYGNSRIQVFDSDFNYLLTHPIKSLHDNTIGLSNSNVLHVDNVSSKNPILNIINVKTGDIKNNHIPAFFLGHSYAAYNYLNIRSDESYIGVISAGAPYILIYDTDFDLKYFIQFKNSKIEMLYDRIKSTLADSNKGNGVSSVKLILDYAIKDGVLYINTFEAGRIISVNLNQIKSDTEFEWKVYDAARPKRDEIAQNNALIQPVTMRFALYGNTMLVYDINKDNEFFDIIQY